MTCLAGHRFHFPSNFSIIFFHYSVEFCVVREKSWYQSNSYYFTGILTSLEAFRRASSIPGIWRFQLWICGMDQLRIRGMNQWWIRVMDLFPLVRLAYSFTNHSHASTAPPSSASLSHTTGAPWQAAIFNIWCTAVAQQPFAEQTALLRYKVVCISPAQEIFLSSPLIISSPLSSLFFLKFPLSEYWIFHNNFFFVFFTSLSFCSLHWKCLDSMST